MIETDTIARRIQSKFVVPDFPGQSNHKIKKWLGGLIRMANSTKARICRGLIMLIEVSV